MIISPNENNWSYDESDAWKLVHDGTNIIFFEQTNKSISTQSILFTGTQEECQQEIDRFGLTSPSDEYVEGEESEAEVTE
jgi:hypothetical protein